MINLSKKLIAIMWVQVGGVKGVGIDIILSLVTCFIGGSHPVVNVEILNYN